MVFNNNEHLYVKINGIVKGDLSAPYSDGSKMDPKSAHYKHVKEKNQKNYDLLGPYIGTDAYFLVRSIQFPNRTGGHLDSIILMQVCVEAEDDLFYFLVSDAYDPIVSKNQEYYIVEFKVC